MRIKMIDGTPFRLTDVNGGPVPEFPADRDVDAIKLWTRRLGFASLEISPARTSDDIVLRSFHDRRHNIRLLDTFSGINWFWVEPRRVIEAYDTRYRRYIGGIGANGFVPAN